MSPIDSYTFTTKSEYLYLKTFFRKSRSTFVKFFSPARIIRKSGRLNIFLMKLSNKNLSYIRDLGNTLLSIRWRWILTTLFLVNFACFVIFGILWYLTALNSGDFATNHTDVCAVNTKSLTGEFLLLTLRLSQKHETFFNVSMSIKRSFKYRRL